MAKEPLSRNKTQFRPQRPLNRPGLDEIGYRITTQPESAQRMAWALPRSGVASADGAVSYPLRALRTRDLADPTMSLIDAYAMAADVLAFYSERVANEGYISTARHRRSVLQLTRMIGYELSPGVASSAHLAFVVENADDPFRVVDVPAGVQAMSIPSQKDELPQIYETIEGITAHAEWNDIQARTERPQNLVLYDNPDDAEDPRNGTLYIFDLEERFETSVLGDPELVTVSNEADLSPYHPLTRSIDLKASLTDRIADHTTNDEIAPVLYAVPVDEVCLRGLGLGLIAGTRVLAVAQKEGEAVRAIPFRVVSSEPDKHFDLTRVVLSRSGAAPGKIRRSPVFKISSLTLGVAPARPIALDTQAVAQHLSGKSWTGTGLSALVQSQNWSRAKLMALARKVVFAKEDDGTLGFHVMRDQSGFFGNTAPLWQTLDYGEGDKGPYKNRNWDGVLGFSNTIWTDAAGTVYPGAAQAYLDREVRNLYANSWAILESANGAALGLRVTHAAPESRADYAITGKSTGLGFDTADGNDLETADAASVSIYNNFRFRSTQIYMVSQHLTMSGAPLARSLPKGESWLELDGLYLDLERGRPVCLKGARLDADGIDGRETHHILDVQHLSGVTRLLLQSQTAFDYDRTTLRINANVALATHGELVSEVLGSGDGRLGHQSFALKKAPLTFVSADTETGRVSSLVIRVDGVVWKEISALGLAGPEDAVYEIRHGDDGTTYARFGDGKTGRRLSSGEQNVVGEYRSGIGLAGNVAEEAISQLKTRPLGIRSVVNPSAATGAAPREAMENAKTNAPGTVKTLGRIVSLTDYEDFALGFAGIGKAQARQLWSGEEKIVHLTIAPETDADLTENDAVFVNLAAAVNKVRDPARPVVIQTFQRRLFSVVATLDVDPAYLFADVELAAHHALNSKFGYDARRLAQSVSAAEVIAVLQRVSGVVSIDLDALAVLQDGAVISEGDADVDQVLKAFPALGPGQRGLSGDFEPAELMIVLSSAIVLKLREVQDG